jgi:hypothetical protein
VQSCDSLTLVGTQFREDSYGNRGVYDEILLYDAVDNFKADEIAIDGMSSSRYGIQFRTSYVRWSRLSECSIIGTVSGPIWNSGTDTEVDHIKIPSGPISSMIVRNSGTAMIANNDWIPHGLATAPDLVTITSRTLVYGGVPVIVGWMGQNATHFQVGAYWVNGTTIDVRAISISWHAEV